MPLTIDGKLYRLLRRGGLRHPETIRLDDIQEEVASGGGGITDLAATHNASDVVVTSSTGTDATINAATGATAGVLTASDKTKLDGIETGAEVNPNAAEVKTLYESNANTNAFTDSLLAKLNSIDATHYGSPLQTTIQLSALPEASLTDKERRYVEDEGSDYFYDATASSGDIAPDDQTGGTGFWKAVPSSVDIAPAAIKTAYESNADTNAFTDAEQTKLAGIEAGAKADHGNLAGLADDDHTQYHNDARGDARYYTQSQVDTALAGKSNTGHTHTASEVTDFSEAVDDRVNALLVEGSNVTLTYDDVANTLTVASSGGGGTFRGAVVGLSAPQSIPHNTFTVVNWGVESIDTDSIWSSGDPSVFVVPAGVSRVRLMGHNAWSSNSTGGRAGRLKKNGSSLTSFSAFSNTKANDSGVHGAPLLGPVIDVVPGDEFEMEVLQSSGFNLDLLGPHQGTWFVMEIIE